MDIQLSDIVKSNYCYYDIHSGCVKGLEDLDTDVCTKCMADSAGEIVRFDIRR